MGAIDVWAQITTDRFAQQDWLATLWRWTGREGDPKPTSVAQTLTAMDEAGVDIALLSAWYGPQGALISNEELKTQIDAAPTRFRGLISVDLRTPMHAVRTIR